MYMEKGWDSLLSIIIYMFIFPSFLIEGELKSGTVLNYISKNEKLTNICEIKALSPSGVRINCKEAATKAATDSCV